MKVKSTFIGLSFVLAFLCGGCAHHSDDGNAIQPGQQPATIVYLVRHAEKVETQGSDPGLTIVGKRRAQTLAQMLQVEHIDLLLSSDYQRTKATLAPLSKQKQLDIQLYDAANSQALVDRIKQLRGQTVVVAGHSNTIPTIVDLLDPTDTGRPDLGHSEYNKIYVVVITTENKAVTLELAYPNVLKH